MSNPLYFTVKTGIKSIVGKDLITDDNVAIFELVKNSYDAHATKVEVTFEKDKIIIADNGKGMSIDDINEKWLAMAYSAKKDGSEDSDYDTDKRDSYRDEIQKRRFYAGAKGIGRFSSDRLGTHLKLITQKENANQLEELNIDWAEFEKNAKEDFIKIAIPHTSKKNRNPIFPENTNHGTILEISGATEWNREKIKRLKHSLEKLINPFSETNDFEIEIICERELIKDKNEDIERNKINGIIRNSILDILKLKTTEIQIKLIKDVIETKLIDRGTLIYHIKEKNKYNPFIDNLTINLYYLNRSAKFNFTTKMGLQPVNYGSIFLFKNGFRVQPYGNQGDDSWGLDYRAQQGYNRFIGSRDLFGRVDIISSNVEQFKEVSSRDGGLVETAGYHQLMNIFTENAHRRLERYVVGVLWGEAFLRKKYFNEDNEGKRLRASLLEKDKDEDDFSIAKSNLGSKIDFINLLKSLTNDKAIEIIDYNKDLVNLVNENLTIVQPKFLKDFEKIADNIADDQLKETFLLTEQTFEKLTKEKKEAEKRAIEAEKKRQEEEQKRIKAEQEAQKAKEEAEREKDKRIQAELSEAQKEKERLKAELAKVKAEKRAEEEKRKKAEAIEAKNKAEASLIVEKDKNTYLRATRKTLSDDAEELIHTIKVSVLGIDASLESILSNLEYKKADKKLHSEISNIKLIIERIAKLTKLITKSNFKADEEVQKVDIVRFVKEYIDTYSYAYQGKINISYAGKVSFISRVSLLDLSIIIDNLISNSYKAKANKININFEVNENILNVYFEDNGKGVSSKEFPSTFSIFELGVKSNIEGSGIGLYSVKKKMKEMYGDIEFVGNNISLKGATFKLIFK